MDFDGYEFNELIFNLEYDIYSALKPKEYEYCVYIKDVSSDFFSFDTIKKFPSKKEALSFLHKSAKIKEKDSNGKVHYYREYNVTRNGVTTKEREEYSLVKTVKGYHPEYSKKTLTMMRRCLKKMKEADEKTDIIGADGQSLRISKSPLTKDIIWEKLVALV